MSLVTLVTAPQPYYRVTLGRCQLQILRTSQTPGVRSTVVVAGRRFGKTTMAAVRMLHIALSRRDGVVWYIAPTYRQAKEIMWLQLKALIPTEYIRGKPNESELSIRLRNGSLLALKGSDNPDALRGPGIDDATFDEFANQRAGVWDVVRPMLSDKTRQGTSLFIGSPQGYNHFFDFHQRGLPGAALPGWRSLSFTTAQGGRVSDEELAQARQELDPRVYAQEFEASFTELYGRVYHAYADTPWPNGNMDATLEDRGGTLYVGMDFNVHPMTGVIMQRHFNQPQILDEIVLPSSSTEEMAKELTTRYPDRHVIICPDASGDARSTKAPVGETDFTILRDAGFEILSDKVNPRVVDRYNNTNSNFLTATGARRARIHPRCKALRKALLGFTYKEGTSQPDLRSNHQHITDAVGYALWQVFNVFDRLPFLAAPVMAEPSDPFAHE